MCDIFAQPQIRKKRRLVLGYWNCHWTQWKWTPRGLMPLRWPAIDWAVKLTARAWWLPSVWNKNKPALQAHRARTLQIYSTSDKLNRGTEMRPVAACRWVNCFSLTRKNHTILRNPLQKLLFGAVLFGVVPGMTILCPALIYVLVNIASYGCFVWNCWIFACCC